MKKTENINLGGAAFTIDQDAYRALDKYINAISKSLKRSRIGDELLEDIEYRISELVSEEIQGRDIVVLKDVDKVMSIMGDPKVFFEDSNSGDSSMKDEVVVEGRKRRKRLYRNPDDRVIGGVASGVAAYFGIGQPWLVRILFLVMIPTFGVSLLVYPLLWLIIPEAITRSDFDEMHGKPAEITNIADSVKTELKDITKMDFTRT